MFKLKQPSIYSQVETLFLDEENLRYLMKRTGLSYNELRLPQFMSTNLGMVKFQKSAEENVDLLNNKFLVSVLGTGKFVKHNESVANMFISQKNIEYLMHEFRKVNDELPEKKLLMLIHGFETMEILESGGTTGYDEESDSIGELFKSQHKVDKFDKYAQLRNLNRAFIQKYKTVQNRAGVDSPEPYHESLFRNECLAPPGYESLNDKEVYNNRDYPSQFIDEEDTPDIRDLYGREDEPAGRPRFMRYQEIPFWQHTKRGVWQDEEYTRETLGASNKELGDQHRKYKIPKTRYDR